MSNNKKFQKLSDNAMEKAAGGTLHVEQEKGFWNLGGFIKRYHVWDDSEDKSKKFDVRGLTKEQAKGVLDERGYNLSGEDPFTGKK